PLHIFDGFVLPDAITNESPCKALFAQDFILRIDEDDRGVALIDLHVTSALRIANISTLRRRSSPRGPPPPHRVSHSPTRPPPPGAQRAEAKDPDAIVQRGRYWEAEPGVFLG